MGKLMVVTECGMKDHSMEAGVVEEVRQPVILDPPLVLLLVLQDSGHRHL